MVKINVHRPHDSFFRAALSQPEVVKELLAKNLPPEIFAKIDLNCLQITQETFVNSALERCETDVLIRANIDGKPGYIYFLLEHQSTPEKLMAVRFIRYMLEIMETHQNTDPQAKEILPPVIGIVIYNGRQKYNYATNIFDLFGINKELMQNIFLNGFNLIDLNVIPDEKLKQDLWWGVTQFFLKHIFKRDILPYLKEMLPILKIIEKNGGGKLVTAVLNYSIVAGRVINKGEFMQVVREDFSTQSGTEALTIAEEFMRDGKLEGKLEGELKGKCYAASSMIKEGMDVKFISKLVGLSIRQINSLKEEIAAIT